MAQTSDRRFNPWVAFAAGAAGAVLVLLIFLAWTRAAGDGLKLALNAAPILPAGPLHIPDAPHMPAAPAPVPK